ncbi:MAG TPA: DMT family transporter [Streptosporangiaceae bacterium]
MADAIAIVCALVAACCFAGGSLLQQGAARSSEVGVLRVRRLLALLRQPRWLAGVGLDTFSFAVQGLALAFGPLALVQPLAATDVLFALPMIARRYRRRLTARDIAGAATVTAGMCVFLVVSPPTSGTAVPGLADWLPVLTGVAALATVSFLAALRVRGRARVIWLAAAAGIIYGLLDALTKSSVDLLTAHGAGVLLNWEPYGMAAAAAVGGAFGQSAFGAGALALSLPVIDTLEPVTAVVIAATIFHERLASSAALLGVQLFGGALAVVGIALLSRSSIVATETKAPPSEAAASPLTHATGDGEPGR